MTSWSDAEYEMYEKGLIDKHGSYTLKYKLDRQGINVLSLFDGMSCGRIALERAGIKVNNYYSSEVDKYAIQIAQKNYPDNIPLGDVRFIGFRQPIPMGIDLLIGGSPCQGFSFAGKQLNLDDPRSALFFEYVRILYEIRRYNPDVYFLLENVKMRKDVQDKISEIMGCEPILINSALVSAQNRQRLYWTNIPNVGQPEDKGIYLKDILDQRFKNESALMRDKSKTVRVGGRNSPACSKQEWDNAYEDKWLVDREKSHCLDANYWKGGNLKSYFNKNRRQLVFNRCYQTGIADLKGLESLKRTYDKRGKAPTLTTCGGGHREPKLTVDQYTWRKLTPLECERLQTVPEGYTEGVSNTQRYRMLGNGWTVDVIAHIFKNLKRS